MKSIYYDTVIGSRVFKNIGQLFLNAHGVYPTVTFDIPKFVQGLGYDVLFSRSEGHVAGLTFISDDDLSAFILKYGLP